MDDPLIIRKCRAQGGAGEVNWYKVVQEMFWTNQCTLNKANLMHDLAEENKQ